MKANTHSLFFLTAKIPPLDGIRTNKLFIFSLVQKNDYSFPASQSENNSLLAKQIQFILI